MPSYLPCSIKLLLLSFSFLYVCSLPFLLLPVFFLLFSLFFHGLACFVLFSYPVRLHFTCFTLMNCDCCLVYSFSQSDNRICFFSRMKNQHGLMSLGGNKFFFVKTTHTAKIVWCAVLHTAVVISPRVHCGSLHSQITLLYLNWVISVSYFHDHRSRLYSYLVDMRKHQFDVDNAHSSASPVQWHYPHYPRHPHKQ